MTIQDFYTAKQAAKRLGVKYHTFLAQAHKGKFRIHRFGWSLMFDKKEIDGHANAQTMGGSTG